MTYQIPYSYKKGFTIIPIVLGIAILLSIIAFNTSSFQTKSKASASDVRISLYGPSQFTSTSEIPVTIFIQNSPNSYALAAFDITLQLSNNVQLVRFVPNTAFFDGNTINTAVEQLHKVTVTNAPNSVRIIQSLPCLSQSPYTCFPITLTTPKQLGTAYFRLTDTAMGIVNLDITKTKIASTTTGNTNLFDTTHLSSVGLGPTPTLAAPTNTLTPSSQPTPTHAPTQIPTLPAPTNTRTPTTQPTPSRAPTRTPTPTIRHVTPQAATPTRAPSPTRRPSPTIRHVTPQATTPTVRPFPTPSTMPGDQFCEGNIDINNDGKQDIQDIIILTRNYNKKGAQQPDGDVDCDHEVTQKDFTFWLRRRLLWSFTGWNGQR